MSRCFPYPPPGYVLPESKQPLIKSIKLQKDKEKAKEERRKERKREKKDKKRKREAQSTPTVEKLVNEKLEKQALNLKGKCVKSQIDDASSDLTNEHEQPICVAKPSYSSEDSQNTDKRRRIESQTNTIQCTGSVLKIRLSSLNKKEDKSSSKKVEPDFHKDLPSTSGREYPQIQSDFGLGQMLIKGNPPCAKNNLENCVEKQPIVLETHKPNKDATVAKTRTSKGSKVELLYKSLLDLVPSALVGDQGCDDDWLCQKKFRKTEISETTSKTPCSLDSNLWPRAQFLPSVDVYALPYTIPF